MSKSRSQILEERLITFSDSITELAESLPKSAWGNNLADQMIRSGSSVVLNYSEARGAESIADFHHKIRLTLKELRETHSSLLLIQKKKNFSSEYTNQNLIECNELISIFVKSTLTMEQKYFRNKKW